MTSLSRALRLRRAALFAAAFLPLLLYACGGDSKTPTEPPVPVVPGTLQVQVQVDGSGVSGVAVAISGPESRSGTTDGAGSASFSGVRPGTYTVQISGLGTDAQFPATSQTAAVAAGGSASASFSGTWVVATVAVTPALDTLRALADSVRLTATVRAASGRVLAKAVQWSSSDERVVKVGASTGVATAVGPGSASVSATAGGTTNQAVVVVRQTLHALDIPRDSLRFTAAGDTLTVAAAARDRNGYAVVGAQVSWVTRSPGIATVSPQGRITAAAQGTTWVVATSGVYADSLLVRVRFPDVAHATIPVTHSTGPDGRVEVSTTSYGGLVYEVGVRDERGLALAGAEVEYGEIGANAVLSVRDPAGLRVPGLLFGHPDSLRAWGNLQGVSGPGQGPSPDEPQQIVPLVIGVAVALYSLTAASLKFIKSVYEIQKFYLTLDPTDLGRCATYIEIAQLMKERQAAAFATASIALTYASAAAGPVMKVTDGVALEAAFFQEAEFFVAEKVLQIGQERFGMAANHTVGGQKVRIRFTPVDATKTGAKFRNVWASFVIIPDDPQCAQEPVVPVATVSVAPSPATVSIGATQQLTATLRDAAGNTLLGRAVTWTSSNNAVATVSNAGLVNGVAAGSATITATSEGKSGTAAITVSAQAPVATITLSPATATLAPNATQQLTPTLKDAAGNTLTGRTVTWSSSATAVATVSTTGLVTAVAAGSATITATSEGKSATAAITVTTGGGGGAIGAGEFVLIQPGTFQMGSTNGGSDERPVHTVNITKAFYLQKTEVTQGQWKAVMGTNPSYFKNCGDDCPVETVSWNDIQEFITKLNQANPGMNYRLPTEAEWEFAARAGTTGDYGGNGVLNDMGWYSINSGSKTHPVAQKLANAWGLYDMHGNVWEWVQDWFSSSYYSVSPTNDPTGPTTGSYRVLRGGSWYSNAYVARSAFRGSNFPSSRNYNFGFRLARTP